MISADEAWLSLLHDVMLYGGEVSPRGRKTIELKASLAKVDMARPVLTIRERKLGYRFMCAEAAWTMDGDNRVRTLAPYSKRIADFSDDGQTFFGSYGIKLRDQLAYVVRTLRGDRESRQAVMNIWRENPPVTKDVPCTLSVQFMIRNDTLDAFVNMRSNDVWLGTPYDWFNFSMWSVYVLLSLGDPTVKLGTLYHYAVSRHLYEENLPAVLDILNGTTVTLRYEPFDVTKFYSPDHLLLHLRTLAEVGSVPGGGWMSEFFKGKGTTT